MNPLLKTLLAVGEAVGKQVVPGGQLIDAGVHAAIDHHTDAGIPAASEGVIDAIEAIQQKDVADEQMFRDGVDLVRQGYHLIKNSLKHPDLTPTLPSVETTHA